VFLFCLVTIDERLAPSPGKSVFDAAPFAGAPEDVNGDGASETQPNMPRLRGSARRRALLSLDPSSGAASAAMSAEVAFSAPSRTALVAAAFNAGQGQVASFRVGVRLSESEACMPSEDLQEVLAQTLSEYVSQSASETESVQIAAIDLNTGGVQCPERREPRQLRARSDPSATVVMLVVFSTLAPGAPPTFDLDSFSSKPRIASVDPILLPSTIRATRNGQVVEPVKFPATQDPDADTGSGGVSAVVLGAAVGGAVLLALIVAGIVWTMKRRRSVVAVQHGRSVFSTRQFRGSDMMSSTTVTSTDMKTTIESSLHYRAASAGTRGSTCGSLSNVELLQAWQVESDSPQWSPVVRTRSTEGFSVAPTSSTEKNANPDVEF